MVNGQSKLTFRHMRHTTAEHGVVKKTKQKHTGTRCVFSMFVCAVFFLYVNTVRKVVDYSYSYSENECELEMNVSSEVMEAELCVCVCVYACG